MNSHDPYQYGGYLDRLLLSRNLDERRSIIVGRHAGHGYPILLDTGLLLEHAHVLGSTGSGKTALALMNSTIQLIRRRDGAVVVIDCKGDPAYFHTVRIEAERAGRTFKWFTNESGLSTHIFNPFDYRGLQRLTLQEVLGLMLQSLNLHHGDDYGRAYFGAVALVLLKDALEASRNPSAGQRRHGSASDRGVQSFQDLDKIIHLLMMNKEEYQAGRHLAIIVNALAGLPQLNLSPHQDPNHAALRHAIHMPEVVRDKQVIYFYLTGAFDLFSVAEISRLAIYSLLSAARQHRKHFGETPRAYCICDEAQVIIAQNIANVLAQARSMGMACILAHQTMNQLNPPGGVDLRELVMNCTAVKQYFSARDPWTQKYISDLSGKANYCTLGYDQYVGDVSSGYVGYEYGCPDDYGFRRVRVQEYLGPRVTPQEIQDISRRDNLCFYAVERSTGLSRHHGFFPLWIDWPLSAAEYRRRQNLPWPDPTPATIVVEPDWMSGAGAHAAPPVMPLPPSDPGATARKLRELQRRLEDNPT